MSDLLVMEIFGPTIQGEGAQAGRKTMFLRLAGCDYACSWCDTKYATGRHRDSQGNLIIPVYKKMDAVEVFKTLEAECKGCRTLTISGGNPALHDLSGLINLLRSNRWFVNVETQGSRVQKWFAHADLVTFSPKPPSSNWRTDVTILDECIHWARRAVIKVVVFDDTDYAYAKTVHNNFPGTPFYLQVGNSDVGEEVVTLRDKLLDKYHELVQKVIDDPEMQDVFVLPQIHTILWGNKPLV